jgi:hypothetical protein
MISRIISRNLATYAAAIVLLLWHSLSAYAFCHSPHDTCEDMRWCMYTNPWPHGPDNTQNMAKLKEAAQNGNVSEIWAWTDRCQSDLQSGSSYSHWHEASAGCATEPSVDFGKLLAKQALAAGAGGSCPGHPYCAPPGVQCSVPGQCCSGICAAPGGTGHCH